MPYDLLVREDRQDGACHVFSGKNPNNRWVSDDLLIRDNCQDRVYNTISGKVLDDSLIRDNC